MTGLESRLSLLQAQIRLPWMIFMSTGQSSSILCVARIRKRDKPPQNWQLNAGSDSKIKAI
jgi:hypothetical protein